MNKNRKLCPESPNSPSEVPSVAWLSLRTTGGGIPRLSLERESSWAVLHFSSAPYLGCGRATIPSTTPGLFRRGSSRQLPSRVDQALEGSGGLDLAPLTTFTALLIMYDLHFCETARPHDVQHLPRIPSAVNTPHPRPLQHQRRPTVARQTVVLDSFTRFRPITNRISTVRGHVVWYLSPRK